MNICLVLGGADCLHADLARYTGQVDGVVACNDAGMDWPGRLDAWVSMHPGQFLTRGWRERRAGQGYPEARIHYGHLQGVNASGARRNGVTKDVIGTEYLFPGQDKSGSSGLFAAKVALIDLGFDTCVLCGIPLTAMPHYWDESQTPWRHAEDYQKQWVTVPAHYRARMRSMSGWTKDLLGGPEWLSNVKQ